MGNVQGGPQDAIGASVDIHGRRMKIERQLGEGRPRRSGRRRRPC